MIQIIILFLVAYLVGSISNGVLIGKAIYKVDIRNYGSGNTGTTNAFRVLGKKGGLAVFLLDTLKGAIGSLLPIVFNVGNIHPIWFGFAAVLGHVFPIFLKFKGGKAVATSLGAGLAIYPVFVLSLLASWAVILYLGSMVSLASIVAIGIGALTSYFILDDLVFSNILLFLWLLTLVRHFSNIKKIIHGTENKVPFGLNQKKK